VSHESEAEGVKEFQAAEVITFCDNLFRFFQWETECEIDRKSPWRVFYGRIELQPGNMGFYYCSTIFQVRSGL
jgi:hypothetical protein